MRIARILTFGTLACLAVAACDGETPSPAIVGEVAADTPADAPPSGGIASAPEVTEAVRTPERGYIAHEWGTFTSVQASDGSTLPGLQHEDEPLPGFVHRRPSLTPTMSKGVAEIQGQVTQKLETPVIYFHTREPMTVRVDVAFPKGILGEWYPQASSVVPEYLPSPAKVAETRLGWDAKLQPDVNRGELLPVHEDGIWAPSRNVDCAMVSNGPGDSEMFLFYRGIGDFVMPIQVTHGDDGQLTVRNLSDELIPDVVLLHNDGIQGGVVHLGQVAAGASVTLSVAKKDRTIADYLSLARDILQIALEADGLYADEARAMVDTWTHSYFHTPGVRVLYITPKRWTDELLPLTLDPPPEALVRTMVGRIEILTQESEDEAAKILMALWRNPSDIDQKLGSSLVDRTDAVMGLLHKQFGRFAEARVRRAVDQLPAGELKTWATPIIALLDQRMFVSHL